MQEYFDDFEFREPELPLESQPQQREDNRINLFDVEPLYRNQNLEDDLSPEFINHFRLILPPQIANPRPPPVIVVRPQLLLTKSKKTVKMDLGVPKPKSRKFDRVKDCQKECPICIEPFTQKKVITELPCKHEYHKTCIDKWTKKLMRCPICRAFILSS